MAFVGYVENPAVKGFHLGSQLSDNVAGRLARAAEVGTEREFQARMPIMNIAADLMKKKLFGQQVSRSYFDPARGVQVTENTTAPLKDAQQIEGINNYIRWALNADNDVRYGGDTDSKAGWWTRGIQGSQRVATRAQRGSGRNGHQGR